MKMKLYRCLCIEERMRAMGSPGLAQSNLKCLICDGPEVKTVTYRDVTWEEMIE